MNHEQRCYCLYNCELNYNDNEQILVPLSNNFYTDKTNENDFIAFNTMNIVKSRQNMSASKFSHFCLNLMATIQKSS